MESWKAENLARQWATDAAIIAKPLADFRAADESARSCMCMVLKV